MIKILMKIGSRILWHSEEIDFIDEQNGTVATPTK